MTVLHKSFESNTFIAAYCNPGSSCPLISRETTHSNPPLVRSLYCHWNTPSCNIAYHPVIFSVLDRLKRIDPPSALLSSPCVNTIELVGCVSVQQVIFIPLCRMFCHAIGMCSGLVCRSCIMATSGSQFLGIQSMYPWSVHILLFQPQQHVVIRLCG